MLAARHVLPTVVEGLDANTDDFLATPFSLSELLARLQALARRTPRSSLSNKSSDVKDITLDAATRRLFRGTREIQLTPTEYRLLEFLMGVEGAAAARRSIIDAVWGPNAEVQENNLEAYIRLLRRKVEIAGKPQLIQTIRGFGYRLGDGRDRS